MLPVAISVSLPSIFLVATIAVVGFWEVLSRRRAGLTFAYGGFLATAGLTVAALAAMGQYHTGAGDRAYFLEFWAAAFPPSWSDPSALARWLIRTHTGPLFAYPLDAGRMAWLTTLVFGAFVIGIAVTYRRDRGTAALLALPFVLTFTAAVLRRYPYGMSSRVTQFLVPSTLLLVGAGGAWLCARVRPRPLARRIIPALAILLVGIGLWRLAHDLRHPYRTPWDQASREFARWFWERLDADGVLVCVRTDLGIPSSPDRWAYDASDQYLCFQRIYSRRHRKGYPPRWDAISDEHPLRCVIANRRPNEIPAFRDWIEANRDRYSLREVRTYPGPPGSKVEPVLTYVVCEFVPTRVANGGGPQGTAIEGRATK